jgi:hypothetical protein
MRSFENTTRRRTHLEIPKAATEPQAVISWGEEFLERAQKVAHEIEELVRQILDVPMDTGSHSTPGSPNQTKSKSDAGDELVCTEVSVDNHKRGG